jgi:hypothetical protein
MQAAERPDHLVPRPQRKVISVAEHHRGLGGAQLGNFETFDGPLRPDGHERRSLD